MVLFWLLFTIVATYFVGTLSGHAIHWALHQRWTGRYHKAHMNHHLKQYPYGDKEKLLSKEYRFAGKDDTFIIFFLAVFPIIALYALILFVILPFWMWIFSLFTVAFFGYANEYIHTQFHLAESWLVKYKYFRKLRSLHFVHHRHMQRNMGIYDFTWDRVFGTYRKNVRNVQRHPD